MKELSKAEEILLLTIWRLKKDAYGVPIKQQIKELTGKDYAYGTLYGLLDQLDKKGYVTKSPGDPTPERGGRSKTYYGLSQMGIKALKYSIDLHNVVWNGVSEFTFDEEAF
ncbi:MAG: hypothetical protein GY863_07035 [bacterium]|nr:hypothetical protein [bacterium]